MLVIKYLWNSQQYNFAVDEIRCPFLRLLLWVIRQSEANCCVTQMLQFVFVSKRGGLWWIILEGATDDSTKLVQHKLVIHNSWKSWRLSRNVGLFKQSVNSIMYNKARYRAKYLIWCQQQKLYNRLIYFHLFLAFCISTSYILLNLCVVCWWSLIVKQLKCNWVKNVFDIEAIV